MVYLNFETCGLKLKFRIKFKLCAKQIYIELLPCPRMGVDVVDFTELERRGLLKSEEKTEEIDFTNENKEERINQETNEQSVTSEDISQDNIDSEINETGDIKRKLDELSENLSVLLAKIENIEESLGLG